MLVMSQRKWCSSVDRAGYSEDCSACTCTACYGIDCELVDERAQLQGCKSRNPGYLICQRALL